MACVAPGFSAAVSLAEEAAEQGAAAGLVAAAQAAGFVAGPVLFAATYRAVPELPFLIGLAVAALLRVFIALPRRTERPSIASVGPPQRP